MSHACHARNYYPVPYSDPRGRPRIKVPFRRMPAAARRCPRSPPRCPWAARCPTPARCSRPWPVASQRRRAPCQAKGCGGRAALGAGARPARAAAAVRVPVAAPAGRPVPPAPAAPPARRCVASDPATAEPLDAGASSSLRCGVLSTTLATCGRGRAPKDGRRALSAPGGGGVSREWAFTGPKLPARKVLSFVVPNHANSLVTTAHGVGACAWFFWRGRQRE